MPRFLHALTTGWLLVAPTLGLASPCLYHGTDGTARVMSRSGDITTPHPQALSAHDCRRLRVASGSVSVYVLSADRQAISSHDVTVGGGPLTQGVGGLETGPPGILKQIMLVLESHQRSRNGSSRGSGDDEYVIAALPVGRIARPDTDILLRLGPLPDSNLAQFELLVDGAVAHRQTGPSQELRLPARALKPGSRAQWKLVFAGKRHEGIFIVEAPEVMRTLKISLAEESKAEADGRVLMLRIADGMTAAGFAWDARELIRTNLLADLPP